MAVDGLRDHAPVQMVHAVRRRGDVVATAWTVVHDGAEPALTLYITGELDLDTVAELKHTLLAHVSSAAGHVTVDLSEVTFMGADGFGLLRDLRSQYERAGVGLMLGPTSRCAQRVLAILAWSDARVYDRWAGATTMPERSGPRAEPRPAQRRAMLAQVTVSSGATWPAGTVPPTVRSRAASRRCTVPAAGSTIQWTQNSDVWAPVALDSWATSPSRRSTSPLDRVVSRAGTIVDESRPA